MDANEYARKVEPASKSLMVAIRKAVWLGKGSEPRREAGAPARVELALRIEAAPIEVSSLAAALPVMQTPAIEVSESASPVPPAPPAEAEAAVSDNEVAIAFGDRRYRVRGLAKNTSYELLKVNVLASHGDRFHVDTFDLYAAKARATFTSQAAIELAVAEEIVKVDLGRVLLKLEQLQDERIRKALEPKPIEAAAMSEAEAREALALLKAPDLFGRILDDFEACGIVGEGTNKLVGYLAAVSRKLERPLAVLIQSSSAAGKSALMEAVLAFVPEEERVQFSAMTGQSLFYMGEANLKHKILAIAEEEGASRAAYALKLLQSEGELTIASTGKDPATGNLVTQEYRVEGPVMMFLTTTAIAIDEELLNRCLVLTVDEAREQTAAIHRQQRERRTLAGLVRKQERERLIALHRNAQRLLKPLAVVNPYADRLTFPDAATRLRRDHEKYLSLIDAIALVHQHQRPVRTIPWGDRAIEYVEVTLEDIERANALAHEVLGRSLDELPPQTRRLLVELTRLVDARAKEQAVKRSELRFTRRELRAALGWGDTQLRVHLERLTELEYVLAHREGSGGKFVYELAYDGEDTDRPHLSGLIDVATIAKSRGRESEVAGRSRPDRGPVAGGSLGTKTSDSPVPGSTCGEVRVVRPKTRLSGVSSEILSYPHLPLAAEAK
jgi:DNA primase